MMAQSSAPTFPAATDSILAPILLGLSTTVKELDVLTIAWLAATMSIPLTKPVLGVVTSKRTVEQIVHSRYVSTGSSQGYAHVARLVDYRPGEEPADAWARWRWELAASVVTDHSQAQLVGDPQTTIRLDVTKYRLSAGKLLQAQELALLRHYIVSGLRVIDPALVVIGGQHDWDDKWWPEPN